MKIIARYSILFWAEVGGQYDDDLEITNENR